jgi:hypothetical protein
MEKKLKITNFVLLLIAISFAGLSLVQHLTIQRQRMQLKKTWEAANECLQVAEDCKNELSKQVYRRYLGF